MRSRRRRRRRLGLLVLRRPPKHASCWLGKGGWWSAQGGPGSVIPLLSLCMVKMGQGERCCQIEDVYISMGWRPSFNKTRSNPVHACTRHTTRRSAGPKPRGRVFWTDTQGRQAPLLHHPCITTRGELTRLPCGCTHSPLTKATMRQSQAQTDHQIPQGRIGWCWDGLGVFQEALPRQRAYCQTSRRARKMGHGMMVGEELRVGPRMGHISIPYTAKQSARPFL